MKTLRETKLYATTFLGGVRKLKGMGLRRAADAIGVEASNLCAAEKGRRVLSLEHIEKYGDLLGYDVNIRLDIEIKTK